jgi:hypothetical protein
LASDVLDPGSLQGFVVWLSVLHLVLIYNLLKGLAVLTTTGPPTCDINARAPRLGYWNLSFEQTVRNALYSVSWKTIGWLAEMDDGIYKWFVKYQWFDLQKAVKDARKGIPSDFVFINWIVGNTGIT